MENESNYFLKGTGQYWKKIVSRLLLFFSTVPYLFANKVFQMKEQLGIVTVFAYCILPIILFPAFIYFEFFSVKCPHCKKKFLWKLAKTSGPADYFMKNTLLKECPECHFSPASNSTT